MTAQFHSPATDVDKTVRDASTAKAFVSELIAQSPRSEAIDAQRILNNYPQLQQFNSAVLNLAYEQYCRQVEAGQQVNPDEFAARFPDCHKSLLEMLQVHEFLEADEMLLRADMETWPQIGDSFEGFELIDELGRGAFSRVFLAKEGAVGDRVVVVKVCLLGSQEAHTLGQLRHPHIVQVLSVRHDELSGLTAISMPYLSRVTLFDVLMEIQKSKSCPTRGSSILDVVDKINRNDPRIETATEQSKFRELLRRTPYVEAVVRIGIQLAEALAYSHERGVYHCDVKPSNVLLASDGQAMLFDFNLSSSAQSKFVNVGGTLPYMAPEQLRLLLDQDNGDSLEFDRRSDIFALGIVLHEMLSGQLLPFGPIENDSTRNETAEKLLQKQKQGPRSLREMTPQTNRSLSQIIERCLRFDPDDRPQAASELAEVLRRELSRRQRALRWALPRRRFIASGIALSCGALASFGIYLASREPYADTQARLGHEAYLREEYDRAISYYSRLIESTPTDPNPWFWRGRAYMKSADFAKAELDFLEAESRLTSPDGRVTACYAHSISYGVYQTIETAKRENWANKSAVQRKAEDSYNTAIHRYREALSRTSSAAVFNNIGFCHWELDDDAKAKSALENALQLESVPQATYYVLAKINRRESLENHTYWDFRYIEKAIQIGPETPELLLDAADIYACAARTEDNGQEYVPRIIKSCERAIEIGLVPDKINSLLRQYPPLKDDLRFQQLQNRKQGPSTDAKIEWLIDPLTGTAEPVSLGQP